MVKVVLALAVGAAAFNFGGKKSAPSAPRSSGNQVAKGGQTLSTLQVPEFFTTAFGNPGRLADRAARAEAKKEFVESQLIPTPARFAFAFGRPDILFERQQERLAKWQWSSEFISKARPDKQNYGAPDLVDDGLTVLERQQIAGGREAYLTGAAKLRYKRLTGQI